MKSKKYFFCILLSSFMFIAYANSSFIVKEVNLIDKDNEYCPLIKDITEILCDKLSTTEENIIQQDIFELSYNMYCPIILAYYEHKIDLFSVKTYLCICFLDKEKKLISLDIEECKTRNIDEIFVLPTFQNKKE